MPARLKFLKQPATEAAHIQLIVTRYTLAYPERRFNLVSDGKLVFQSTGSGKLYDVLVKVYGLEMAREMLEISKSANQRISEAVVRRFAIRSFAHSCLRLHRRALAPPRQPRLHHTVRQPALVPGYVDRLQRDPGLSHDAAGGTVPGGGDLHRDAARGSGRQRAPDQGRGALSGERRGVQRGAEGGPADVGRHAPMPQIGLGGATPGVTAPDTAGPEARRRDQRRSADSHGPSVATPCSAQASTTFHIAGVERPRTSNQDCGTSFQRPASERALA